MSLVTIPKIAQIFMVWKVRFSNDDRLFIINVGDVANELNYCMCLAQIKTVSTRFFPQKTHRIEAQNTNTVINKIENNADKFFEQERIGKIKINLILAEGTPDFLFPADFQKKRRKRISFFLFLLPKYKKKKRKTFFLYFLCEEKKKKSFFFSSRRSMKNKS